MTAIASVTLASSRQIRVTRFHVQCTYEGVLFGTDDSVRRHLMEVMPDITQSTMGFVSAGHVVEPPTGKLPEYFCLARLKSTPINSEEPFAYSELVLAWFVDDVQSVSRCVDDAVQHLDWDALAIDDEDA